MGGRFDGLVACSLEGHCLREVYVVDAISVCRTKYLKNNLIARRLELGVSASIPSSASHARTACKPSY